MLIEAQPAPSESTRFRQIVEQHYSTIYGYVYRLSGSAADAEDLTQQTFMIAQQKLHQLREQEKLDRWLYAIARTCFLKSRRRKRPTAAANFELNVDEIPEQLTANSPFDEERLQFALNELSDDSKLVVTMFYFEELSYKQIAAELDIPIGTVMSRLARAKGQLRHRLADKDDAISSARSGGTKKPSSQFSSDTDTPNRRNHTGSLEQS